MGFKTSVEGIEKSLSGSEELSDASNNNKDNATAKKRTFTQRPSCDSDKSSDGTPSVSFDKPPFAQKKAPTTPKVTKRNVTKGASGKKRAAASSTSALLAPTTDVLLNKPVAYDITSELGQAIQAQFNCSVSRSTLVNNHVIGTVSRRGKQKSGQVIYEVAWNNSQYGVTQISHSNVYTGIENHTRLQSQLPRGNSRRPTSGIALPKPTDPFDVPGMDALLSKSRRGEPELAPCSSGSDSDNDDNAGDEDMIEEAIDKLFSQVTHMDRASASNWDFDDNDHLFASDNEEELSLNVDDIQGLDWNPRGTVGPKDFKSLPRPSTIVPQFRSCFDNPTRSFFSFLPIAMWEKIVYESNTYAHEKMRITKKHNIAGYYWRQDISLQEMMQFFGLLIQMALLPIPGRDYRFYWTEQQLYPWVACMTLRRFKQIRSTLHFNVSDCEDSLDPLHKVRPIYATIQEMMGRYVDLGSEFSLDEASAACRSSFGRHLIVFNPMKNCGKFHFRFYLLCCSVTYVCIKVRIHVRTDEMVEADKFVCESFENEDGKEQQASSKVLNQLILDMARPIFNKGITLNFNNYYASPGIAVALLRHKVLCRGTLWRIFCYCF